MFSIQTRVNLFLNAMKTVTPHKNKLNKKNILLCIKRLAKIIISYPTLKWHIALNVKRENKKYENGIKCRKSKVKENSPCIMWPWVLLQGFSACCSHHPGSHPHIWYASLPLFLGWASSCVGVKQFSVLIYHGGFIYAYLLSWIRLWDNLHCGSCCSPYGL